MLTRRGLLAGAATSGLGLSACSRRRTDPVVVYTDQVPGRFGDHRGDWIIEKAERAGHTIELLQIEGPELGARFAEEAAEPRCDVLLGYDTVAHELLRQRNLLATRTPAWAAGLPGPYWPLTRDPVLLIYSSAAFPGGRNAPADWPDLWTRPDLAGHYQVETVLEPYVRVALYGLLHRYRDDAGQAGVSKAGWDALATYYRYGLRPSNRWLYQRMDAGEVYAGVTDLWWWRATSAGVATQTDAATPAVGVPMLDQHISLLAAAPHAERAAAFVDWYGSPAVQGEVSRTFGLLPALPAAQTVGDQGVVQAGRRFTEQRIDWAYVARHSDEWLRRVRTDFGLR